MYAFSKWKSLQSYVEGNLKGFYHDLFFTNYQAENALGKQYVNFLPLNFPLRIATVTENSFAHPRPATKLKMG